ncbi:MAG: GGDEF domain-containing protein [Halioglobus sp.]|nr:GGDEF domain-containing protein [Halioglobus sp.]
MVQVVLDFFERTLLAPPQRSVKEVLLLRLSGIIAISLIPLAYARMREAQWAMVYLDILIVCVMSLLFLFVYVSRRVRTAGAFLAFGFIAAALMTTLLLGADQVLWAYPALIVAFFMLDTRQATILSAGFVLCFLGILWQELPIESLARICLTLVVTMLLANAFALTNRRQQRKLREMANIDPLTGAGNRRAQNAQLDRVTAIFMRSHAPASLLILDIDFFKRINDVHGHIVGDQVLVEVADLIRRCTRLTDSLYRYGGEEFVVIAEQTSLEAANSVAGKLREAMEQHIFSAGIRLTVSIGVSQLQRGEGRQGWLGRTDAALFRAKTGGRNQVVIAPAAEPVIRRAAVALS